MNYSSVCRTLSIQGISTYQFKVFPIDGNHIELRNVYAKLYAGRLNPSFVPVFTKSWNSAIKSQVANSNLSNIFSPYHGTIENKPVNSFMMESQFYRNQSINLLANQWTDFSMVGTTVMNKLIDLQCNASIGFYITETGLSGLRNRLSQRCL